MLVTEQDAKLNKWCPMVRLRWESRPLSFNTSNPGKWNRFKQMIYRWLFPRLYHQMQEKFFRCRGSGCMMWRWEDNKQPGVSRKGYCGLAGAPHNVGE